MTTTGQRIIAEALKHRGEDYVYGANVDFTNPKWDGPWDCAEFVSWVVYQITGKVYGCLDNDVPIDEVEPFTGGWKRDIKNEVSGIERLSISEAVATEGAILLRYPNTKHVAFSMGNGRTVEAAGSAVGVIKGNAYGRGWNYACKIVEG